MVFFYFFKIVDTGSQFEIIIVLDQALFAELVDECSINFLFFFIDFIR